MKGLWVLALLIFISALPVLYAFFWYRRHRILPSLSWFLPALGAGAVSVFAAALLRRVFPSAGGLFPPGEWRGAVFFDVFVHTALMEELGRFIVLFLFFRLRPFSPRAASPEGGDGSLLLGTAAGLAAGLAFAVIESASYGVADLNIALLRAFTAAPLHGACGARVGTAAFTPLKQPGRSFFRFLSAVIIHGMYDFIIISPGLPSALSVLIAFSALAASVQEIRRASSPASG
jgi:RsiW-degrading membrane proteinase PrsW (M82 family)